MCVIFYSISCKVKVFISSSCKSYGKGKKCLERFYGKKLIENQLVVI